MKTYIYGCDIHDGKPMSQMLKRELIKVGIKKPFVVTDVEHLKYDNPGYLITFGAKALADTTGLLPITENRGMMHPCLHNENILVFATISPGFVYRNRKTLRLLRDDLKLFSETIRFDRDGSIR